MHSLTRTIPLAGAIFLLAAGTASAHIQAFPTTNGDGSQALVTFTIPHGCDDKGTTKLEINFPKEVLSVTPVSDATWTASGGTTTSHASHGDGGDEHDSMEMDDDGQTTADAGDDSVSTHGDEGDDHDSMDMDAEDHEAMEGMEDDGSHTATWTAAQAVDADQIGVAQAVVVMPTDMDGETLWLPAVQTCEGGATYEWTTRQADAESPAPSMTLAAASGDDPGSDDRDDERGDDGDDDGTDTAVIIALILGGLGTILGLVGALRGRGSKE